MNRKQTDKPFARRVLTFTCALVLGSAMAYDDNLEWKYDTSGRPADTVAVADVTISDLAASLADSKTVAPSPAGGDLEGRAWTSWLSDIVELTRSGIIMLFR